MLNKEMGREDLAKLALDRGQISQETYNRMVPPINPDAQVVEATNLLPKLDSIEAVGNAYLPGVGTLVQKGADAVGNMLSTSGVNMPGMDQAMAEVPIRNPAYDTPVEAEQSYAQPAYLAQQQSGQASGAAVNPLAGLEGALGKQKQALMKSAELGAEQAAQESAYQQKMFEETEKQRADQAVIESGRAERVMKQEQLLDEKINNFSSKPANVAQVFANAGTGQKLLMGFALFLGAAPNSSGQNKALQAMQASIDADLAKAKTEVGDRQNAYKEMKDTFKDERQAESAARIAYLNNAQLKLNQIASQYKGPQIKANYELLSGKIDEEIQKNRLAFVAAAQNSSQFQQADQMTQSIMKLPKELQKEALQEKGALDEIESQRSQLKKEWAEMDKIQSVGFRAKNPVQYGSLVETFEAKMFPIVKKIVGERMTDADARILIKSQAPGFLDNADTRQKKFNTLESSLEAAAAGRAPILRGLGLLPKQQPSIENKKQSYVNYVEKKK